jgi:hypothetical protein
MLQPVRKRNFKVKSLKFTCHIIVLVHAELLCLKCKIFKFYMPKHHIQNAKSLRSAFSSASIFYNKHWRHATLNNMSCNIDHMDHMGSNTESYKFATPIMWVATRNHMGCHMGSNTEEYEPQHRIISAATQNSMCCYLEERTKQFVATHSVPPRIVHLSRRCKIGKC